MGALLLAALIADAGAARTLASALAEFAPPQFVSAGARPCVLQMSFGEARKRKLRVGQFASLDDSAAELREWSWATGAALEAEPAAAVAAACGEEMGVAVGLAVTSCRSDRSFAALLADPRSLLLKPPGAAPPRVDRARKAGAGYWQAADEIGCARAVTSPAGDARVWTQKLEGPPGERGLAFLQWRGANGTIRVFEDGSSADLHLDACIDVIEPVPGSPGRFLVLGLRAYLTTFAGDLPRRFAEVISIGSTGVAERVPGAFSVRGRRADLLLLRAPQPATGKFRHSLLARRWLAFDRAQRAIFLETVPGEPVVPATLVAVLHGGQFSVQGKEWQGISQAPRWGT